MAKRPSPARRPIVALTDLAPQRDLRAGAGQRVFGTEPAEPTRSGEPPHHPQKVEVTGRRRVSKSRA